MKKIAIVLVLLSFIGCAALQDSVRSAPKPSVRVTGVKLGDLSMTDAKLLFDLEVENPYSVPLPLVNLGYKLASQGQQFLSGQADMQGTVPANGKKTIPFPVSVNFLNTLKVLSGIKPGAIVPYNAVMTMGVDAPAVGRLDLPIEKNGEFPVPTPPSVQLESVKWQKVSITEATANLNMKVKNTNQFPIGLAKFAYDLKLAGTPIVKNSLENQGQIAKNGGESTLQIPISVLPTNIGWSIFSLITGKSSANYSLGGAMDISTPFGPLSMPFNTNGNTQLNK